jgi:hypothetical protein
MWVEILCGLVAYKVIRRFFFDDGDDASYLADLDSSHSDLCFAVAARWVPPPILSVPRLSPPSPNPTVSLVGFGSNPVPGSRSSTPADASSASASPTPTPASASTSMLSSSPRGR